MREGWHRYLAAFAATKDYVVREVPVTLQKRHSGKSKFAGKSRILKGLTDLIAVKFQVSVFGDPMHLFGRLALWFFFIGFLIAAGAVFLRFYPIPSVISPRPLLYAVILFELAALVTFVMGIITEALVYLRDSLGEMKTQNQRLLDELARRSGVRLNQIPDDSETRHYERSDDRVDERSPEMRQESRRPERRDSRPDPRRRDSRDSRDSRDTRGPRREEPRRRSNAKNHAKLPQLSSRVNNGHSAIRAAKVARMVDPMDVVAVMTVARNAAIATVVPIANRDRKIGRSHRRRKTSNRQ